MREGVWRRKGNRIRNGGRQKRSTEAQENEWKYEPSPGGGGTYSIHEHLNILLSSMSLGRRNTLIKEGTVDGKMGLWMGNLERATFEM